MQLLTKRYQDIVDGKEAYRQRLSGDFAVRHSRLLMEGIATRATQFTTDPDVLVIILLQLRLEAMEDGITDGMARRAIHTVKERCG